jgi:hypothetical protein
MEAARAARLLDQARAAIEALARQDPRLAAAIRTALGGDDPDRRASAAKRAIAMISAAAERAGTTR